MAQAPSTTISTLLGDKPCVKCLNPKEKLALLVYLLGNANSVNVPENLSTYMTNAACYSCATDGQMLDAIVSKLWTYYAASETAAELRAKTKCLNCLPEKKLRELLVYLLLTYINSVQAPT